MEILSLIIIGLMMVVLVYYRIENNNLQSEKRSLEFLNRFLDQRVSELQVENKRLKQQ
jgi:sulfite exporter TauE/SafE